VGQVDIVLYFNKPGALYSMIYLFVNNHNIRLPVKISFFLRGEAKFTPSPASSKSEDETSMHPSSMDNY
jgi:hypothetical protein